ncbi:hypothetical protein TNCV_243341 [Trichonephila clavipes]|uniref:Uncharacterized protein n=1 Tax=Trichonephila clavipes TaxID=2585209 RepID=A0A8X6W4K7_TRICX|nr:hypothetical protein TNCV_243341 [Trichonephila clavipes]
MEMQYQKTLPPPAGGRPVEEEAKRERNRSDVTRARVEERRGRGRKALKRVRGAPKRSREKELLLFFLCSQNKKEWSLQVGTYKRNHRRKMQEPAFSLIPVLTSGKGI